AIRDALDAGGEAAKQETALLHRAERWRERLLEGGDAALGELLGEHPRADRQKLRQLVRNARDERGRDKPPRAFRELFRELRDLLSPGGAAGDGIDGDAVDDAQGPDRDRTPTGATPTAGLPDPRALAPRRSPRLAVTPHGASGPGPAHRDLRHEQRGLADADRHALPVLAAGAHALVQGQVVADHRHPLHG